MTGDFLTDQLVFIDTNILVYAYDKSAGRKHDIAIDLIAQCWERELGCLSLQVLQEFFVTVTRKITFPLETVMSRQIVADLANWQVHEPEAKDILHAIDLYGMHQISFWDAMIIWSATQLGCTTIWSEDLNPGQVYEGVQLLSPFKRKAN